MGTVLIRYEEKYKDCRSQSMWTRIKSDETETEGEIVQKARDHLVVLENRVTTTTVPKTCILLEVFMKIEL